MDGQSPAAPPDRVGRFDLLTRLQGGARPVYRAEDRTTQVTVSLRLFHLPAATDADHVVRRLARTYKSAREVRHPGIVPVLECGQADGYAYVAAEDGDERRLAELLAEGPLSAGRAAAIARDLADALACAHEQGHVHGSIHPSGVVLDPRRGARWLDFGVADDEPGNPMYLPPERLAEPAQGPSPHADQYALGVLFYEMLCGQWPYSAADDGEVVEQVKAAEFVRPRKLRSTLPRDLEAICLKAMAYDQDDRYPTCLELADDLRRWLDDVPVEAGRRGLFERWEKWIARNPVTGIATSFLVVVMGLAGSLGLLTMLKARAAADAERQALSRIRAAEQLAEQNRASGSKMESERDAARADAEKAAASVTTVRKELSDARDAAQKDRDAAFHREEKLKQEKQKLEQQKKDEADARTRLEHLVYTHQVSQSYRAWLDHDPDAAADLLEAAKPLPKRTDLRGWEWHYLHRLYKPTKTFTYRPDADDTRFGGLQQFRSADGTDLRSYVFAYAPDNAMIALALYDNRVTLWNSIFATVAARLEGHTGVITGVAFNHDGSQVATAAADRTARIWNARTGKVRHTLKGHDDAVLGVAFSPDGKQLVSTGADRKVVLWNADTGAKVREFAGHDGAVLKAAFGPDGAWFVTVSADRTARIWDVSEGKEKHVLRGHLGDVFDVAVSPDGKQIARPPAAIGWSSSGTRRPARRRGRSPAIAGPYAASPFAMTVPVWHP
jgi:hypothetical protein